jgi:hypothetical protein
MQRFKANAEWKETRYRDRKRKYKDLNQMQRGKYPDTEIGKGMQRFEPNAERRHLNHMQRGKKPDTDTEIGKGMQKFEPNAERKETRYRDRKRNAEI